jgi:hypothetical protein
MEHTASNCLQTDKRWRVSCEEEAAFLLSAKVSNQQIASPCVPSQQNTESLQQIMPDFVLVYFEFYIHSVH